MKKILLIATGGTIASYSSALGLTPGISSEILLEEAPDVREFCQVDSLQLLSMDSTNIQPSHWLMMANTIKGHYEDYDGFVITHGTDTMAYTSAALSYLIQNSQKPIVLTGSQKPIGTGITDARKNLVDSFWFCAYSGMTGVYIVFDGKAIVGTRARKVKAKSYSAFESINFPVAAYINDQRIIRYLSVGERSDGRPPIFYQSLSTRVFLLKLIPGLSPDILDYVGQNYDAIIIESYGTGGLPFLTSCNFLEKVERLAKEGKIFVMSTQVMLEGSDMAAYEVGTKAMQSAPLLQTYDMTVEAVVAKLMWITAITREFSRVEKIFYQCVNNDIYWP